MKMPKYGQNAVTNPTGTQGTTGWAVSGATAVAGGIDASGYCFRINSTGNMKQEVTFTTQPLGAKISAKFYSDALNSFAPVRAYMKCTVVYTDKEPDEYYIPCTGGIFDYVPGVVNGQNVNWVSLESSFSIDDQKTLQKVIVELVCENLGTYGYFDDIQVLPLLPDRPDLTAKNGEPIFDEYGINDNFIKPSQNLVWNSSFEILERKVGPFDYTFVGPKYWDGNLFEASDKVRAFDGTKVLKLGSLAPPFWINHRTYWVKTAANAGIAPYQWGGGNGRVSFYHMGEAILFTVVDKNDNPLPLYNTKDDPRYPIKYIPKNDTNVWKRYDFGIDVTNFPENETIFIKFTYVAPADGLYAFIDAVQVERDFTGGRASFYSPGPVDALQRVPRYLIIPNVQAKKNDYWINFTRYKSWPAFSEPMEILTMVYTIPQSIEENPRTTFKKIYNDAAFLTWTVNYRIYQGPSAKVWVKFEIDAYRYENSKIVSTILPGGTQSVQPNEDFQWFMASGGLLVPIKTTTFSHNFFKLRMSLATKADSVQVHIPDGGAFMQLITREVHVLDSLGTDISDYERSIQAENWYV